MVPLWVLALPLSHPAVRLYATLAAHADFSTDDATIGRKRLAAEMCCSINTIDRAKAELIEHKVISVEHRLTDAGDPAWNGYIVHRLPPEARSPTPGGTPHARGRGTPTRAAQNENHKNEIDRAPTAHSLVRQAWEAAPGMVRHKPAYYADGKVRSAIDRAVRRHGVEDVVAAVGLYAEVVRSPDTTWSHRWPLREFLERGVDRFVPDADPLSAYRRGRGSGLSQAERDANKRYDKNVIVAR
jgi:Helix-turn-helix domain